MRLTLILSMLLFNAFCMGQTNGKRMDSIFKIMQDSGWSTYSLNNPIHIDSLYGTDTTLVMFFNNGNYVDSNVIKLLPQVKSLFDSVTINGNEPPILHRKKDTIPVILIIINTNTGLHSTQGFFHPLDEATSDRRIPYWIKGYSVRELHSTAEEFDSGMTPKGLWGTWWEHLLYLDENKRVLSKNIIVWDAKEIQ